MIFKTNLSIKQIHVWCIPLCTSNKTFPVYSILVRLHGFFLSSTEGRRKMKLMLEEWADGMHALALEAFFLTGKL